MQDKSKSLNNDRLKIVYDQEADVLYVTKGTHEHTDYFEYTEDVILRFHPETKQLVGFTLIDFSEHFAQAAPDIGLPFTIDFQMHNEADLLFYED